MAWRKKKDSGSDSENKFNKFFNKNNGSRFNNKIYERDLSTDSEINNVNKKSFGFDSKLNNNNKNETISYHNNFDPTRDNNKNYFRNNYKSNYKSNYRSNHNKVPFKKNTQPKSTTQTINDEILNIEKQLASNKYMTKIKKDELEKKIKELNIKKKNEFPQLSNSPQIILEPKISCWNNLSQSKIYTNNCPVKISEKKKIYMKNMLSLIMKEVTLLMIFQLKKSYKTILFLTYIL